MTNVIDGNWGSSTCNPLITRALTFDAETTLQGRLQFAMGSMAGGWVGKNTGGAYINTVYFP